MGKEFKFIDSGDLIKNLWCPFCSEQILDKGVIVNSEHGETVKDNVVNFICKNSQKSVEITIKVRNAPIR
jgi:hypothetical protein